MRYTKFRYWFFAGDNNDPIVREVSAFNSREARILAQAEQIRNGHQFDIITLVEIFSGADWQEMM